MESAKRRRGSLYRPMYGPSYRRDSVTYNRRYFRSKNPYRHSRDSGDFMLYLVLSIICLLSVNSVNMSNEVEPDEDDDFVIKCETLLPECECDDYSEVIGILCHNVSDFDNFTKILEDELFFKEKRIGTTYEISLFGSRMLPRQFLRGLIVFRLSIDDSQTEGLEDGAFDGVIRLRRFQVRMSSISNIPDFRPIQESLRNLNLDNSLITSVDGDQLKNLTHLETFSAVNNSIGYVADDAFQGTENLLIFDMSHNRLQFLPTNLFDPWKNLKKAVLSFNRLLHVNHLFAVTHPQFIYLDHNNLTDLDSVLHPNMSNVETIQLSNNLFSKVSENSFNDKLINVRFIYLDHCLIEEFHFKHYSSLEILSVLDLSYNYIEKVVNQTIDFGKDIELDFTGNKIIEFNARLTYKVKRVYLNKNQLTSLGSTLRFSQMAQVSLANNRIESLAYREFHGAHGIVILDLQGNLISTIEPDTFKKSIRKSLTYLDLSRNKIRKLNGCVQTLSLLTSLNLTDNQIEGFEIGEFQGLNELTDLYLQGNRIKTLGNEVMRLDSLKNLVVSYNRIRTIKGNQLPTGLQYIFVEGNPLQCDCQILSFIEREFALNLRTDVPLCLPPNRTSPIISARCPEGCQCYCTNNSGSHYISVDCSSLGLTQLPPLFAPANASMPSEYNSTSLMLFLPRNMGPNAFFSENGPFIIQDEIRGLDLSHNNLKSVEGARLPQRTKHLLLSQNLIHHPPTSLLYSLEELNRVTLSGNPWTCDCGTSGFKRWILSHSEFILDVNETRCDPDDQEASELANRAIWTLTDLNLCPASMEVYISVVLGVLSIFLVASAVLITWTRYERIIKVWLYAHGVSWVKERDIDRDKDFDAFISFSNKDQHLVITELIQVIQKKAPNVRLLLHYKDFMPGELIPTNIINAVRRSKRTVLILSRNFFESEWCMFEFLSAHQQAMKDRIPRILVIKLGDLPNDSEMPEIIQEYLKSTTYLTWGEKYFWDNLLYSLPTSNSRQPNQVITNDVKQKYPVFV